MVCIVESFSYNEDKIKIMSELGKIAKREGKKKSQLIVQILEEYVKAHAKGNSTFTLENWQDPEFRAVPSLFAGNQAIWSYIKDCDKAEKMKLLKHTNNFRKMIISSGLK